MTTIAYKDGIVAYDTRITVNNTIIDDDYEKMHEVNNIKFFLTGTVSDFEFMMDSYFKKEGVKNDIDAAAIVIDGDDLYHASIDDDGNFWRFKINKKKHYAIGSGREFALAFMDTGMDSHDAIRATMGRDCYTGGIVKIYSVEMKGSLFNPSLYENYDKHKRAQGEHK